jgi:archaeosine synthase
MLETILRDGLARCIKWNYSRDKEEKEKNVTSPEILFVQTTRTPIPSEARVCITSDPSITDGPFIYHRGNTLSEKPSFHSERTEGVTVLGELVAEIPPSQWKPQGLDRYLKDIDLDIFRNNEKRETGNEIDGNVLVVYDSTPDEELDDIRKSKDIEMVVFGNSLELFARPRKFVESLIRLKKHLGPFPLIYTPGLGEPMHLAILTYMGIDLFDTLPLIRYARKNTLLTPSIRFPLEDSRSEWFCSCKFCQKWQYKPEMEIEFEHLLGHNYILTLQELGQVRSALKSGNLRELVETRIAADPNMVNLLRFMDKLHYDFVEEMTPIARKTKLIACTIDSLTRPEVLRFQNRIRERYAKPEYGKVLLLLPCSAKKPYSQSQSHLSFLLAIRNCNNPWVVHDVIVTSPLGIVPRELELAYPAQHYDIPVTGTWYEEEKEAVRKQLKWLISNFKYKKIVAHIDKDLEFLLKDLDNYVLTVEGSPTSKDSIKKLIEALNDAVLDTPEISAGERQRQMMTTLAKYHFGSKAGEMLMEGADFSGFYPYLKIRFKGKQIGMIQGSTGLISLTLDGGARLLDSGVYWVRIDEFPMKGDVFAPGVLDADPVIRPYDEVVVYSGSEKEKRLKAVGRAQMSGSEMVEAEKGTAVKVRHFVKN